MYRDESYITGLPRAEKAKSETAVSFQACRLAAGQRTRAKEPLQVAPALRRRQVDANPAEEKVRVWPELVLRETVAALAALILLGLLAMLVAAPLEELADPAFSMNPSKAPWYFLGLQELLVYFPPWLAGVAIPVVAVLALAAIPFLDTPTFTARTRSSYPFADRLRLLFSTGLALWLLLTVIDLFFRGPNWNWQWPDGTPLASSGHAAGPAWLPLLAIGLYAGAALWSRFRRPAGRKENSGPFRRLLAHLLTLVGLVVSLQVVLANLLNFIHIL